MSNDAIQLERKGGADMAKIRAGISLDSELYDKLRELAEEDRRSISSLVNALLWKIVKDK